MRSKNLSPLSPLSLNGFCSNLYPEAPLKNLSPLSPLSSLSSNGFCTDLHPEAPSK